MVLVHMIDFVQMCHKEYIHVCKEWHMFEILQKLQEASDIKEVLLSICL